MNAEMNKAEAEVLAAAEDRGASLLVMIILFAVMIFAGLIYIDRNSGGFSPLVYAPYRDLKEVADAHPTTGPNVLATGERIYGMSCGSCHQASGSGQAGTFPPLARSEWVNEPDPARLIRIALVGAQGPITVNGQEWNLVMSANANTFNLSDEDVAAVLSYVRQAWGNKAPIVKQEEVKAVRDQIGVRFQFTAQELNSVPVKK